LSPVGIPIPTFGDGKFRQGISNSFALHIFEAKYLSEWKIYKCSKDGLEYSTEKIEKKS
jgi:hypothetical protein